MRPSPHTNENSSYKVVALLITLILWVVIMGTKEASLTKIFVVNYILAKDMEIVNSVPHEVAFRIAGSRLALKKLAEMNEPLSIDLASLGEGLTTVRIHNDSVNIPAGLRVLTVAPNLVTPRLERLITKVVPIELQVHGSLPKNKKLIKMVPEVSEIEISGARALIEPIKSIKSEVIDLQTVDASQVREIGLNSDGTSAIKRVGARSK
jgi:YbbR domain-containing protein